jgi:hypothetical protein
MDYITNNVRLSQSQKSKIRTAYSKNRGTSIQLSRSDLNGTDKISLTRSQAANLNEARRLKKGIRLTLSKTQLSQSGGFLQYLLPAVAAALPILGRTAAIGAVGSAAGAAAKKVFDTITGKGISKKKIRGRGMFHLGTTGRR